MICKTCFPKLSWEGFLPQEALIIIKLILKCLNLGPSFSHCAFSIKLSFAAFIHCLFVVRVVFLRTSFKKRVELRAIDWI